MQGLCTFITTFPVVNRFAVFFFCSCFNSPVREPDKQLLKFEIYQYTFLIVVSAQLACSAKEEYHIEHYSLLLTVTEDHLQPSWKTFYWTHSGN